MVLISYNWHSLKKHKITPEQIREAMTDPMRAEFDISRDTRNNYQWHDADNYHQMIVGHTYANVLLEIGAEMTDANALHFFHAQKVSPQYRSKYEEWLQNA